MGKISEMLKKVEFQRQAQTTVAVAAADYAPKFEEIVVKLNSLEHKIQDVAVEQQNVAFQMRQLALHKDNEAQGTRFSLSAVQEKVSAITTGFSLVFGSCVVMFLGVLFIQTQGVNMPTGLSFLSSFISDIVSKIA